MCGRIRRRPLFCCLASQARTEGGPVKNEGLNGIVADVVEDLDLRIKNKNAKVEVEDLPSVLGNRSQLYQVFLNLIGNSIKFSKQDLPLEVKIYARVFDRLGKEGNETQTKIAQIFVQDNGIGFDEK